MKLITLLLAVNLLILSILPVIVRPGYGCLRLRSGHSNSQQNERKKQNSYSISQVRGTIRKLKPLHQKLGKPQPGEWLASHDEKGQSFSQYVRILPNQLTGQRNVLYVQPIGEFSEKQKRLVELSSEFLSIYYQCETKILPVMSENKIPERAKRTHPQWGDKQLLTSYILEEVLSPELPPDAFATIAFTASDLWPGAGWNFVFGYASLRQRVGVWSLYRHGDPDASREEFVQCLSRTIKVATHETGHMFSINHCTAYQCNMQGSNSLPESDRQPLYLCPECHAKVLFSTKSDPVLRFEALSKFCKQHDLDKAQTYFENAKKILDGKQ